MSFPRYPVYKDSGVEWLGEVPEHWNVCPLKRVTTFNDDVLSETTDEENELKYVEISDVHADRGITGSTTYLFRDAPSRARRKVRDGDVLVSTVRTYLRAIAPVFDPPENLVVSTGFAVVRPIQSIVDPRFMGFSLRSQWFVDHVVSRSVGVSYPAINAADLVCLYSTIPPRGEQVQIARFLDHETAKIDALIQEQQRLIELLKEKRQAVISHAVTKGLDPSVPMKDSGVEWLGEVPEHWEVRRVKQLAEVISKGTTPTTIGEEFQDDGVRFLKAENIVDGCVLPDPKFFISEDAHASLSRSSLAEGDVLIVIAGATTGKSAVLQGELLPANTNQAVSFIRPLDTDFSEFIHFWLSTDLVQRSISLSSVQSAQPNLSMEDLGEIPVPVPPAHERGCIVSSLATKNRVIDGLINEAGSASALLSERRSALISAAVTGKIDVRDWNFSV